MINVAICDDDIATTGKIEEMLCRIAKKMLYPGRNRGVLGWERSGRCSGGRKQV